MFFPIYPFYESFNIFKTNPDPAEIFESNNFDFSSFNSKFFVLLRFHFFYRCISNDAVCDLYVDCFDGTDETSCIFNDLGSRILGPTRLVTTTATTSVAKTTTKPMAFYLLNPKKVSSYLTSCQFFQFFTRMYFSGMPQWFVQLSTITRMHWPCLNVRSETWLCWWVRWGTLLM